LGGKVLVVRRDPGITDLHSSHREHGCSNPPVTVHLIVRVLRTWLRPATERNCHFSKSSAQISILACTAAKDIVDDLTRREVKLSIGGSVHDPTDPVGRLLFNLLVMVAEFEADLIRSRTREGMQVAKAAGRLPVSSPNCPRRRRSTWSRSTSGANTPPRRSLNSSAWRGPRSTGQSSAPVTLPPKCSLCRGVRKSQCSHSAAQPRKLKGCCADDFGK